MSELRNNLEDLQQSTIMDLSFPGRPLLIACGGMVGGFGIPPFEFYKLTRNLEVNKIFLRDLSLSWYHAGLPGLTSGIEETAIFLQEKVDQSRSSRVILFGNSMGGYAAILFGILLKADIIHAFSPQTFIHDENFIRSKKKIRDVHDRYEDTFFNLKTVMRTERFRGVCNIYYDRTDRIDARQAANLQLFGNVVLHPFPGGGHGLIRLLKRSGRLEEIMRTSFYDPVPRIGPLRRHLRSMRARLRYGRELVLKTTRRR